MKQDASPLISKLTLLVLTLILACLMVLVVRSFRSQPHGSVVAETPIEEPSPTESPAPVPAPMPAPIVRKTNPIAVKPPVPTNPPGALLGNDPAPTGTLPPERSLAGRVSFGPTDPRPAVIYETLAANGSALLAGIVTLKGTPKPEIPIELGPTCGAIQPERVTTRHYVVGPKGELANVVVYIKSGLQRKFGPAQPGPLIDQVGCMFHPYVSAVVAGQTFQVRNSDPVLHNVHLTPKVAGNYEFNVGQPIQGQINTFSIANPEMHARIKCDVHPWMFTYISVFDHPYFAITDTNGFFQLPAQIPAGRYSIFASHLKLGITHTDGFELRAGEQRSLQFEFQIPPDLQAPAGVARSN